MVNLDIFEIIHEVYEDLLHEVILKNIPKDCPDIREIRINYLIYIIPVKNTVYCFSLMERG